MQRWADWQGSASERGLLLTGMEATMGTQALVTDTMATHIPGTGGHIQDTGGKSSPKPRTPLEPFPLPFLPNTLTPRLFSMENWDHSRH